MSQMSLADTITNINFSVPFYFYSQTKYMLNSIVGCSCLPMHQTNKSEIFLPNNTIRNEMKYEMP